MGEKGKYFKEGKNSAQSKENKKAVITKFTENLW